MVVVSMAVVSTVEDLTKAFAVIAARKGGVRIALQSIPRERPPTPRPALDHVFPAAVWWPKLVGLQTRTRPGETSG